MKKCVLVADDDASIRDSFKKVLQGAGYKVVLASDGRQAIARFDAETFDLVILDITLPLVSGWDAFEHMAEKIPSVPLVLMSGLSNRSPIARAIGASAFLEKPVDVMTLLQIMEKLLNEPEEVRLRRLCNARRYVHHSF